MRSALRGIRVFGGLPGFLIAAVIAGLLNDEVGRGVAIAWIVFVVGALALDFALRLWRR